jgi:hypothetical protein
VLCTGRSVEAVVSRAHHVPVYIVMCPLAGGFSSQSKEPVLPTAVVCPFYGTFEGTSGDYLRTYIQWFIVFIALKFKS